MSDASGVYRLTQEDDAPARSLSDIVAHRSSFMGDHQRSAPVSRGPP